MIDTSAIPVTELLPHGPESTLLDRFVAYDERKSVAVVDIGPASAFFDGHAVPAWVGIEYMAQAVAAHAGFEARLRGEPPAVGFLLGTRSYENRLPAFPAGSRLTVTVEPLWTEAGVGVFRCTIALDEIVAEAVVNTYRPGAAELERLRRRGEGG
jgi:predicted hotdog family 3-hydroxylacyl-ACP dehydratase